MNLEQKEKLTQREINLIENEKNILNAKSEIVIDYFTKEQIEFKEYDNRYKSILFKCPICRKNDYNLSLSLKSFVIFENYTNTCSTPDHDKKWKKIKTDLLKIWDNSLEKENISFSLNVDYIKNIIEKRFPKIIRQKNTNILFYYNEEHKHYIEMKDNSEYSDIENIIYDSFFNEKNEYLTSWQAKDVKNIIKKNYKFICKDLESCRYYNCKNGVLDIKEKKLLPHSDNYFFNYISNINYDPTANSELLNNFIKEVVTENKPIEITKKIIGHIHYQGEKLQKGFLFKGTKKGRNGKGTYVSLIEKVISHDRTVTMETNQINSSDFAIYQVKDKVLYIDDDFKIDFLNSKMIGFLNRMISKAYETMNPKNKPMLQVKHTATPIIQANKDPRLKADDDGGFYLRFVVVNFKNEFGKAEKNDEFLGSKLLNNDEVMSTMLNYLVEGYHDILYRKKHSIKGNFFKKDEVSHIDEWKRNNNSALSFIYECCEISNDFECPSRSLWQYYNNNWNLNGSKLSEKKFISIIKDELDISTKRKPVNNKKVTFFIGLKCSELNIDGFFGQY